MLVYTHANAAFGAFAHAEGAFELHLVRKPMGGNKLFEHLDHVARPMQVTGAKGPPTD